MGACYRYIRYLAYMIEIIVFYVLEQIPNTLPNINGVKPLILILIGIMIALFEGEKVGTVFGLIVGLFLDCGSTGTIGFYSIIMACAGFLVGVIAQRMIKINLVTALLVSTPFIFVVYIMHFLVNYLFCGYKDVLYAMCSHYLIGILYTFLLSPFIYFFNKAFAVNIKREE